MDIFLQHITFDTDFDVCILFFFHLCSEFIYIYIYIYIYVCVCCKQTGGKVMNW